MLRLFLWIAALVAASPVSAAWQQATSKHFVVIEDTSPADVKAAALRLERFDGAMRALWGMKDRASTASSRVTIYMLADLDALHRLLGGSEAIAGIYMPRAGEPVSFMPRTIIGDEEGLSRAVLFHEYAHHVMFSAWGDDVFPMWFTEGFAEFHAVPLFDQDGMVRFGAFPQYRRYSIARSNTMPVERMLSARGYSVDAAAGDAFYARAWLLMDYLLLGPDKGKRLAAYIKAVNSGTATSAAMATLGSVRSIDLDLDAWGRRQNPPSVGAKPMETGADIAVHPLSPAEIAVLPARMLSQRAVNAATAPQALRIAQAAAARFPGDAEVENELAEAGFDAANTGDAKNAPALFAVSEAAATRALTADPHSVHALLYQSSARIAVLKLAHSTDSARWQTARQSLLAANRLDPEDPRPLIAFYDSFAAARQPPTRNAEAGLLYAQALAPYDTSLRLKAGTVLLGRGAGDDARKMLQPIAFNPHQGQLSKFVGDVIAKLDAEGPKAALGVIATGANDNDQTKDKRQN